MLKLLSCAVLCGLTIFTTCVAAQTGKGSTRSKGVFLDDGQLAAGYSSSFGFSFGSNGSTFNATSGGSRLRYIESKSNAWGATLLYDGKLLIQNLRFALVYMTDLSAESDCSIEYDITSTSSTDHPTELLVKQILNNDEGKPLVTIIFDSDLSDEAVELKHSNGKQTACNLSKGTILIITEDGDVHQTSLPDDMKEKPVVEIIRTVVKKQQ